MNNLKVIQLLPELNFGGVERGVKDFSKALVERGHQSIVISNGGLLQEEIETNGAKHINLAIHKKRISSLLLAFKLRDIYEKENPDIVHVRSRMPAWINFLAFKKLKKRPLLISTFHGLYSTPIYSQVMSKVDHTISISNTVKDYIQSTYKMTDDQITIIPRGCDSDQFNKEPLEQSWLNSWYKEYPQTKGKKILTLPTRITKWKGVDSFIDLVESLNDDNLHALVVGPVSVSKKKYYQSLINKVNNKLLSTKITFTGSRSDIANIYKFSDIVYNLSIQPEPFGRTTIEAISCGSAVAGWKHGGTEEILEELFPKGLANLNDIKELKSITLSILNNNEKPLDNIFTSKKMIDSTINLYYDLLNRSL